MALGALELALAYQAAQKTLTGRLAAILALLWRQAAPWSPGPGWEERLPAAVGAFTAAQETAAGMGSGYAAGVLSAQGLGISAPAVVDSGAFAGSALSGLSLESLLSIPAVRAQQAVLAGVHPRVAAQVGEAALGLYARTEVTDAGRDAVQVETVVRHVSGYVRVVGPLCCGRCAILSGRWYRYSTGFLRHPSCRCVMVPADRDYLQEIESPQDLYREGRITDLTAADRRAIDMGADISQVVNAKRSGLSVAGDARYTAEGTTVRGIAGARLLSAAMDRAQGKPGRVYTNFTVGRAQVAKASAEYGPLLRSGLPFLRVSPVGVQRAAYRFAREGRLTVAEIMKRGVGFEETTQLLINNGYVLTERDAAGSVAALTRLFNAS